MERMKLRILDVVNGLNHVICQSKHDKTTYNGAWSWSHDPF